LGVILLCGVLLRAWELGKASFWYDEVVTMRVASQQNVRTLARELRSIDATAAPLHPMLLHWWIGVFGPSETSARSMSVLFGVATVAAMAWVGTLAADRRVGLWAAWLGATSPLLIQYSRETRMYSLLVFESCLAWGILLSFRRRASTLRYVAFSLLLVALVYTHPLGLLMLFALAVAYWPERRDLRISPSIWALIYIAVALAVAPWAKYFFDHDPEFVSGRQPLKMLLGLPIGFTGGNRWVLLLAFVLIVAGWMPLRFRFIATATGGSASRFWGVVGDTSHRASWPLVIWFLVPPGALYAYSLVGASIFGPARYTVYVAPAYLILLAGGLVVLSAKTRYAVAMVLALLAARQMRESVYAPDLKADWRSAARMLKAASNPLPVVVVSDTTDRNLEVETARYYLAEGTPIWDVRRLDAYTTEPLRETVREIWVAAGVRNGVPVPALMDLDAEWQPVKRFDFPGLRLELRVRRKRPASTARE
jgi:uncharacterized membrane protein